MNICLLRLTQITSARKPARRASEPSATLPASAFAREGVHALAGYLEGRSGAPGLCFAVLVNKRAWKGDARALIDDLVELLAAP